jgi:hypothetical protein
VYVIIIVMVLIVAWNADDEWKCNVINIDNDCAMIPYKDFMISERKFRR